MRNIVIPMKGRMMHSISSELTFQPYGRAEWEVINSVSRADLNISLMNAAESRGVKIDFQQRCTGIDLKTVQLRLLDEREGTEHAMDADLVIGADGSESAVRGQSLK